MGIDESWSFLKSIFRDYQSKLHEWGAMPKPLGETKNWLSGGFSPTYDSRTGHYDNIEIGDYHDWVPLGDTVEKPELDNKKRLLGLKPSDFHVTSLTTQRPHLDAAKRSNLYRDWVMDPNRPRITSEDWRKMSKLDQLYNWLQTDSASDDWDSHFLDMDGMDRDEYLNMVLQDLFGKKQYALWAPEGAVGGPNPYSPNYGFRFQPDEERAENSGRYYDPDSGL